MPLSALRFLVIDDHPFHRAVLVRLLDSLGAGVTHVADDGLAALEVITDPARPVDIVISDISMPRMDGLELVRRLAELGAPVSLIVSSALDEGTLASVAAMARAYGTRLLGVIGKPPTAAKLLPLVQAHRAACARGGAGHDFALEEITTSWVSGDFHVVFQPQVALAGRGVLAMHAALRWHHPAAGVLAADAFGAAVRARGLQEEFAWFLLDGALAACRRWRERGVAARASIPLLLDELTDVRIAERVAQAAQAHEVPPTQVVLCLRPAALLPDARVLENLARFRMNGFTLAIDTTQGALGETRRMPLAGISELRLQADVFVRAQQDPAAHEALQAVLQLAATQGMRIVACELASTQHGPLLQAAHCDAVEGTAVSPPLAVHAILQWVRQWEAAHQ